MPQTNVLADEILGRGVVNSIYSAIGVPEDLWELSRQTLIYQGMGKQSIFLHERSFESVSVEHTGLAYVANHLIHLCTSYVINSDADRDECIAEVMRRLTTKEGFADWDALYRREIPACVVIIFTEDPFDKYIFPN